MPEYLAPGAYIEEIERGPKPNVFHYEPLIALLLFVELLQLQSMGAVRSACWEEGGSAKAL